METIDLYGLRIRSELPLHQSRIAYVEDSTRVDVDIRIGNHLTLVDGPLEGRLLLDLETDRRLYSAVQRDDGSYWLRFHGTCDFVIDADLRVVTVRPVDDAALGLAGILAAGTMLSFLLTMSGCPVLHASAVQVGDRALAFVGASGMGKSTMATLLCADGAELITDDVLRLDLDGVGPPRCYLGATAVRLRKGAASLAERFGVHPAHRRTADDRDSLHLPLANVDLLPLTALVVPVPDHGADHGELEVVRLAGAKALVALLSFPRVLGWQDKDVMGRQMRELGDIVERVPVYVARLPWGPPFPDSLGGRLLERLGLSGLESPDG